MMDSWRNCYHFPKSTCEGNCVICVAFLTGYSSECGLFQRVTKAKKDGEIRRPCGAVLATAAVCEGRKAEEEEEAKVMSPVSSWKRDSIERSAPEAVELGPGTEWR